MFDQAIVDFFSERKKGWLKKKIKSGMSDREIEQIEKECEEIFSFENWMPNAAKRAGQMSISTHPCTFSHPASRKNKNGYVTPIISNATRHADGYLRSGNVDVKSDAFGNAAALDVYKFLSIKVKDGVTVIDHIKMDTEFAKSLLNIKSESYDTLKKCFMDMVFSDKKVITSSKIKQVYFPVDDEYHQLSILSNSGMIFKLRERIDALRFSDSIKGGRENRRKNIYSDFGYSEIYDITTIGYGGTKPQNISILNNQHAGKAHLLLSVPPFLEKRDIRFPTKDFFTQSLRYYDFKEILKRLDNVFKIERAGKIPLEKIRKGRDNCLADILNIISLKVIALRDVSINQFWSETNELPAWQKLWLCKQYEEERLKDDNWLNELCKHISLWIDRAYKKIVKNPLMLGEAERSYIASFINEHSEVLK